LWLYGPHTCGKGAPGVPLDTRRVAGTLTYDDFLRLQVTLGQDALLRMKLNNCRRFVAVTHTSRH
jgi:hypothetical protein